MLFFYFINMVFFMKIYRFKITLRGIRPPIWRRIEVPENHTLRNLHLMIQSAMGWENRHLYAFRIDNMEFTDCSNSFHDNGDLDDAQYTIAEALSDDVKKFRYEYDFGDGWDHEIQVEDISDPKPGVEYPVCLAGKRACPPEDCGGVFGYYRCLEALEATNKSPEDEELLEWMGEYDPQDFDISIANFYLSSWMK